MAQVRSWAGLDVHARSVFAVTMDATTGELRSQRLSGDRAKVVEFCSALTAPTCAARSAASPTPATSSATPGWTSPSTNPTITARPVTCPSPNPLSRDKPETNR